MKKLMPLMVLAIILLIGCAKEETVDILQANEDQPIYRVQLTDEGVKILETLSYEEIMSRKSATAESRSNPNAMANANFTFNGYSAVGHGMQNNSGAHGSVEQISLTSGDSWKGDAYCVSTWGEDDNRAVGGWEITEDNNFFGAPLGWLVFVAVEDNGEGANAPSDKVNLFFAVVPPGVYTCDDLANDVAFPEFGWIDVDEGGWVQVQ